MKPQPLDGVPDTLIEKHEHLGVSLLDANGQQFAFICQPGKLMEAQQPFRVRRSGNVGQEILDPEGKVYAWTTDEVKAIHICKLLNIFEKLKDKKASGS